MLLFFSERVETHLSQIAKKNAFLSNRVETHLSQIAKKKRFRFKFSSNSSSGNNFSSNEAFLLHNIHDSIFLCIWKHFCFQFPLTTWISKMLMKVLHSARAKLWTVFASLRKPITLPWACRSFVAKERCYFKIHGLWHAYFWPYYGYSTWVL